jgi:hypothetical protein
MAKRKPMKKKSRKVERTINGKKYVCKGVRKNADGSISINSCKLKKKTA